ncbi:MAG: hypothetical protein QOJ45_1141 [Verrucomicrobiota bacterium]|jgi:hypothetical protein
MRKLLLISLLLIPLVLRAETKVPPEKELKAMVRDTLLAFNKGIQEKNFSSFYKQELAALFRDQMSLEKFTEAFKSFFEKKGYDLSGVAKSEPVFDEPPSINSDGVLVVNGYYPTRPNKITFKLKYLSEKGAWKIVGINVQVFPVIENTGKAPSEKEAKALALDSLMAFNQSLQEKNFDSFHQQLGTIWRKEVTPEKLQEIFQSFIDKDVDISPIKKVQPKFETKPAINDDGMLVLKGSYPTQPSKVVFTLKYVYETESWKLVGINVVLTKNADRADKTDDDE